jgi:hypothetical protein
VAGGCKHHASRPPNSLILYFVGSAAVVLPSFARYAGEMPVESCLHVGAVLVFA